MEAISISKRKNKKSKLAKKSLQKLPNAEAISLPMERQIEAIMGASNEEALRILEKLKQENPQTCIAVMRAGITTLGGKDRDDFIGVLNQFWHPSNKNMLWEFNHSTILVALEHLTKKNNRFPGRGEIETETGLSRTTINKHLKQYFGSQKYHQRQEEFFVMRENLLSRVYKFAVNGDMKAAKIFIEFTGKLQPDLNIKNQQNNFIQINGLTITEADVMQFPAEQQAHFQKIIEFVNVSRIKK